MVDSVACLRYAEQGTGIRVYSKIWLRNARFGVGSGIRDEYARIREEEKPQRVLAYCTMRCTRGLDQQTPPRTSLMGGGKDHTGLLEQEHGWEEN